MVITDRLLKSVTLEAMTSMAAEDCAKRFISCHFRSMDFLMHWNRIGGQIGLVISGNTYVRVWVWSKDSLPHFTLQPMVRRNEWTKNFWLISGHLFLMLNLNEHKCFPQLYWLSIIVITPIRALVRFSLNTDTTLNQFSKKYRATWTKIESRTKSRKISKPQ